MKKNPAISTHVHWAIREGCYSGTGHITGDTYFICPQIMPSLRSRPFFDLSVRTNGKKAKLDVSQRHEELMIEADEREQAHIFENPSKMQHEKFLRVVSMSAESARKFVVTEFGIDPGLIQLIKDGGPADPERYQKGAREYHVYLRKRSKGGHLYRVKENPYTSPWTRWSIKVEPGDVHSYVDQSTGQRRKAVYKWGVHVLKEEPGKDPVVILDAGSAISEDEAKKVAKKLAAALIAKDPRNPNDIRVFDQFGKCFYSVQGNC